MRLVNNKQSRVAIIKLLEILYNSIDSGLVMLILPMTLSIECMFLIGLTHLETSLRRKSLPPHDPLVFELMSHIHYKWGIILPGTKFPGFHGFSEALPKISNL